MDDAAKYVRDSRAAGLSDDQIKQSLLTAHWSPEQIQAVLSSTPSSSMPKPKTKLIIILALVLITFAGVSGTVLFLKIQPKSTPIIALTPTPAPKMLAVAFIKLSSVDTTGDTATRSGKLTLYDFDTRQAITPVLPANQASDFLPILSPWSPSGRYLAMLGVRNISLPQPLFLYDNDKRVISYFLDTNTSDELAHKYSSFQFQSSWQNDQYLIYGRDYDPNASATASSPIVDTSGKVSTKTIDASIEARNNRLQITYSSSPVSSVTSIKLDGKILPALMGNVVGLTNKYIVALKKPEMINMQSLDNNKELSLQLTQAKDPESVKILLDKASNIRAGSTLFLYPIDNPASSSAVALPYNSWIVVDAQTLPSKNSVIIHEQDSLIGATKSRFSIINLDNSSPAKVIAETAKVDVAEAQIQDESSISLTSNDQWLVVVAGDKIDAWNLDSGEMLTLCDSGCSSLRVYNPNRIRFR